MIKFYKIKLKNSETLYENSKNQYQKIGLILKEKERKITQLSCYLTTAEVRSKLLEEQVAILEKDLKQQNMGTSDNLSDAIEVIKIILKLLIPLHYIETLTIFLNYHSILLGEKYCNQRKK